MKIALLQPNIEIFRDKASLIKHYLIKIKQAADKKAGLICLPELALCPYFPVLKNQQSEIWADEENNKNILPFKNIARRYKIFIILPFYERCKDKFYNSCIVISDKGKILHKYTKSVLPDAPNAWEKDYFSVRKNHFKAVNINGVKTGIIMCYERYFPELVRKYKICGAGLVICPAASSGSSIKTWENIACSHALANGLYYAAVNRVGKSRLSKRYFYGNSLLADPRGRLIKKLGGKTEGMLFYNLKVR